MIIGKRLWSYVEKNFFFQFFKVLGISIKSKISKSFDLKVTLGTICLSEFSFCKLLKIKEWGAVSLWTHLHGFTINSTSIVKGKSLSKRWHRFNMDNLTLIQFFDVVLTRASILIIFSPLVTLHSKHISELWINIYSL